ncbi:MAG: hypothetical protein IIA44_10775 [Acidobacteria bacterium]|nr:hypothetical protein [Acidobacteriota bacterium]
MLPSLARFSLVLIATVGMTGCYSQGGWHLPSWNMFGRNNTSDLAPESLAGRSDAPNLSGAQDFVAFVLSAEGQQILTAHGFTAP